MQLAEIEWEVEERTWSPKGEPDKKIPFTQKTYWIDGDYSIEVAVFPRTVNISVLHHYGEEGYSASETWSASSLIYRQKVHKAVWEACEQDLIKKAFEAAYEEGAGD